MKKIISLFISLSILAGCGTGMNEMEQAEPVNGGNRSDDVIDQLSTSVEVVPENEQVTFITTLQNTSDENVTVMFPSGQKIEIVVSNQDNQEVYRYSINKSFLQAIEHLELKPDEEVKWEESWDYELNGERAPSGSYEATVFVVAAEVNGQKVEVKQLTAIESFTIPQKLAENNAFKNIVISGENGEYLVTGEARVFEGSFFYRVEDGHDVLIDETIVNELEGAPAWSPFTLKLSLSEDKLPINGTITLLLYEKSANDGSITNEFSKALERFE